MAGKELKYEIINQIGVAEPKYDLRPWSPDHSKMGKGITFSESELTALADLLAKEVEFLKED